MRMLVGQLAGEIFVPFFFLGEIPEQASHADVLGLAGGAQIEIAGLLLHGLDLIADGVERQILGQPEGAPAQQTLDVLATYRRQMRPETMFIGFEKTVAMTPLLLGHFLEHLCGVGIALLQILGERHVDAAVLFLGGDRHGQAFTLGQVGKILHWHPHLEPF
jgi:hypothetical protein